MIPRDLARLIDHTLLKAEATEAEIKKLCKEAVDHHFFSVCINSRWLPLACKELNGSKVIAISVVGFPLGANISESKALEAVEAVDAGAREIDMVIDLGAVKSGHWTEAGKDIASVVKACGDVPVKVILETCYLSEHEITQACKIAVDGGAKFVKTSTGYGSSGAHTQHVHLMRKAVGPGFGVKASGGIKTREVAIKMVEAGATRLGCSASVAIVSGTEGNENHGKY